MIVLETALPAKFAATIVEAIGHEPPRPAALRRPRGRCRGASTVMPADAAAVQAPTSPSTCAHEVVGFSGYSGSGKTTLVEQLIARAPARRASACRWSSTPTTSSTSTSPGKDSWRHRAGRCLRGRHRLRPAPGQDPRVRGAEPTPTVHQLLAELVECDWVLVEGFKHADLLKIEVWRATTGKPAQYPNDPFVVGDRDRQSRARCPKPTGLPMLDLERARRDRRLPAAAMPDRYEYTAPRRHSSPPLLTLDEALSACSARSAPVRRQPKTVSTFDALGRVLAAGRALRRSTCRRPTTPRWTAMRCAAPMSRAPAPCCR